MKERVHCECLICPMKIPILIMRYLDDEFDPRSKITEIRTTTNDMAPDIKVHGANIGPTWDLSAPDGPHVGPMNLVIRSSSYSIPGKVAWFNHTGMYFITSAKYAQSQKSFFFSRERYDLCFYIFYSCWNITWLAIGSWGHFSIRILMSNLLSKWLSTRIYHD